MLEYRDYITRSMLRAEPMTLFVFGDNFERKGFGGQAKEMRGEPNAIGIVTKHKPTMEPSAFLRDSDLDKWYLGNAWAIKRLRAHTGLIVWPKAGIGTGLAMLDKYAPTIATAIKNVEAILR